MDKTEKIKVLVVDDSAYMRYILSKILTSHPKIEVIDTARDGIEGLQKIKQLQPDVVTLDIEMPRLDGIGVLEKLKEEKISIPVVVFSKLAEEGAEVTIKALELGAVDFITKPKGTESLTLNEAGKEIIKKVRNASRVESKKIDYLHKKPRKIEKTIKEDIEKKEIKLKKVVVIASSTGGPRALQEVITRFPGDFPACILIIQHMPPNFTKSLANRINSLSKIEVKEAEQGDRIKAVTAFVAPGDYHMRINEEGIINLTKEPLVNGVRPAADVTMESVAKNYRGGIVGVVLTGMGYDGARGGYLIKKAGGKTIAEDIKTCVVDGMPSSLIKSGNADIIAPIEKVADEIIKLVNGEW